MMEIGCSSNRSHLGVRALLTEGEVSRSWGGLFNGSELTDEQVEKAEFLIDALRPESPLRRRLQSELEEIRELCEQS